MRKPAYRLLALLLLLCLTLQPLTAHAAVDTARECSLELDYSSNGTGFGSLDIRIYRIADIYADGSFSLTAPFDDLPVKIHGITSQREWRDTANTLAAYIISRNIQPTATQKTDASGKARFSDLNAGIYLVLEVAATTSTHTYRFENFCIFLPTPLSDGTQDYDISAKPKSTVTPNAEQPEEVTYQVVKLWKDPGNSSQRPKSITVDILKDGAVHETVRLNADNNWTYSWTVPEGSGSWSVVEKDVPKAYTVVITSSGTTFTITNTRPAPNVDPPKTGDTFALRPWLTVMALSGLLLAACGILQKRKRK